MLTNQRGQECEECSGSYNTLASHSCIRWLHYSSLDTMFDGD